MIDSFSDVVSKMRYHLKHKDDGYAFPLMPKYNKTVGNLLPGQYTVVSGMAASGKTSFVDQNYVLGTLLQHELYEDKPPVKILYFSLKDTSLKKFQSLLCSYLMIAHNIRIDIPTLNSQPGRIYDINEQPRALAGIDAAEIFFNKVIANESLHIYDDVTKPSAIEAIVREQRVDADENTLIIVVVDSTDHLGLESDGHRLVQGADLDYKFDNQVRNLVKECNIHAVIVTPAHGANSRFPKENEPNFRQLGIYGRNCDKGVVLYNAIAEGNSNYLRCVTDPDHYIGSSGINMLRFWHVVRNVDGIDGSSDKLLFMAGSGYMMETFGHLITCTLDVKNLMFNEGGLIKNPMLKTIQSSVDDAEQDTEIMDDVDADTVPTQSFLNLIKNTPESDAEDE